MESVERQQQASLENVAGINTYLNQRDPFVQWEIADVQFNDAGVDYVIRHNLQVSNPRDVHYRVIKQYTPGTVYEPTAHDAKQWTTDYIVLRSDTSQWTGRILLGVPKNVRRFALEQFDIPDDFVVVQPPDATFSDLGIAVTIDNPSGDAITTGVKTYVRVPFACTVTSWTLLSADSVVPPTSGSIVIDIYKDTYANFHPTGADTITGSDKPTISSANKATSTALTGWTTTIAAGDVLGFVVDSVTTLSKVVLVLGLSAEI